MPSDCKPRSTMANDTLHCLDRAFHIRARQFFRALVLTISILIPLTGTLCLILTPIFPEKGSTFTSADSATPLKFPSFESLDTLRRPRLYLESGQLFLMILPATMMIFLRWLDRKINHPPYSEVDEALLQDENLSEEEKKERRMDGPASHPSLLWADFHITSWRGYSPQHAVCGIENSFSYTRITFGIGSLSSATTWFHWVLRVLIVGQLMVPNIGLGMMIVFKLLRQGMLLMEEPQCRLHPELFSPSASSVFFLNAQGESMFPNSTVLVQEDGQVVVNGTILYTQGMDIALFTVCSLESLAFLGGALVGLILAYQVILRLCWSGRKMVQRIQRMGAPEEEKLVKVK